MKTLKNYLIIGVIILVVAGLVTVAMWPQPTLVNVDTVRRGNIDAFVEEQAKTRLPEVTRITMPLAGRIEPITVREGDAVKADQVVATMETDDLNTDVFEAIAMVGQYEKFIESMVQSIAAAEKQVIASEALASFTSGELARLRTLEESKAATPSDVAEMEYRSIESRVDTQRDELTVAAIEAIKEAVKIALQDAVEQRRKRERDRARATIRTPVAGTILNRRINNEQYLAAGEELLTIGQLDDLEAQVDVLTSEVAHVRVGQRVELRDPTFGEEPMLGTVHQIEPEAFTKTSSLGVDQQRVPVIVRLDEGWKKKCPEGCTIGVGYRLMARIIVAESEDTLVIPRTALFRGDNGQWQLFAVRDGQAKLLSVKLGLMNDTSAEVIEGLNENDQVILAPESALADGTQVEALGKET
ncbi:efflux RND transporter periplasmic adaptor subunit [Calycomorphotria hydatis]|uniref:Efflux system component YknX n=1 Tax=Calycomorphotria hydatis TaxID=2528027 RepID=A0A517T9N6_9PLAN|nr:efflux RND transporter periplasmic adaptor subunit [Calycomorphotria hydatis]QDT65085.1 Putative efflux system component YknX [Calycomorphotria hydatis]